MGRKNTQSRRSAEKRKLMLVWLDTASKLKPEQTLYIPMKHPGERAYYVNLGREIIQEMESFFDESVYHGLITYGTSKDRILYLGIGRSKKLENVAFIKDKHKKDSALMLMVKSKHTRKAQINILLSEGYSKEEIKLALGDKIPPEELLILDKICENIFNS